jgi:hypothetical protein
MSYATPAELRTQIGKTGTTGPSADAALQLLLDAATEAVDGYCNWGVSFEADAVASARFYPGTGKPYLFIDPCVEVSAVAVKDSGTDDEDSYTAWVVGAIGTTTTADVFPATGDPRAPRYGSTPYTMLVIGPNGDYGAFTHGYGFPTVKVTSKWGYAVTVPDKVKQATLIQAARWFKRGEGGWSDALASPEMGTLLFRKELDPDVAMLLRLSRLVKPAIGRR